jgi:hypothetical protein
VKAVLSIKQVVENRVYKDVSHVLRRLVCTYDLDRDDARDALMCCITCRRDCAWVPSRSLRVEALCGTRRALSGRNV